MKKIAIIFLGNTKIQIVFTQIEFRLSLDSTFTIRILRIILRSD